ncbi:Histidine protein kinase SLN1 [Yarrowia sp. C11]|nr:Histidine protein kinase SLN1 [Yarrowia sp. E02]KAG5365293.1 Histidine protein kinase SLN1 [Yarrowia sp. C11]
MKFRISLKWQLSFAVSFTAFCCLGLLSIITYFNNQGTVLDLRRNRLTVIAQLKSSQISYYLKSLQTGTVSLGSREFLQTLLMDSYNGASINITSQVDPFVTALESSDGLGGVVYDYEFNQIAAVLLDDPVTQNVTEWPLSMLPVSLSPFQKQILRSNSWMLQGPEIINSNNDFVFTMTTAVGKNGFEFPQVNGSIVGYITVLVKANGLMSILNLNDAVTEASKSDLSLLSLTDDTSEAIYRQFSLGNETFMNSLDRDGIRSPLIQDMKYTYALPTNSCMTCYTYEFPLNANEGAYEAYLGYKYKSDSNNASYGSILNVQYARTNVAVGYAKVTTNSANLYPRWAVIAAQSHSDVYKPLYTLRNILLISVFSLGAGVCLVTLVLASWAVGPILRLQAATDRSTGRAHKLAWWRNLSWKRNEKRGGGDDEGKKPTAKTSINTLDTIHSEKGARSDGVPESTSSEDTRIDSQSKGTTTAFHRRHDSQELKKISSNPNMEFKVPAKVENRKRFVIDELSELTDTFNIMAEELRKQYDTLDQQVKQRTKEIESAKELAETANEAKTLFIANITHELQTPLNAILGLTAVCMGEKDVVKVKRNLKVIYQSGELLLHLLTDLLTFSKNQLGKLTLYEVDFTIAEVVMQLESIFQQPCQDLNINFSIVSSDHALVLHGDMNRMLQVAINLISSSLKSLTGGDSVEVAVKVDIEKLTSGVANKRHSLLATSTSRGRGNSLTLAPSQNSPCGSFTSATNRESVSSISGTGFLSLQVNTEHTEHDLNEGKDISNAIQNSGTELGLSICRQLAELMDGEVHLENPFWFRLPVKIGDRSNSGIEEVIQPKTKKKNNVSSGLVIQAPSANSTFTESTSTSSAAPVAPATPTVPAPTPSPVPVHPPLRPTHSKVTAATCKVLIVEDNHVNKEVMTRMLNLEGIRDVSVAVDGLKAVEAVEAILAQGQMFDVIFMDVQMPVMDGREATRIIRSKLGYTNPIIAVSAYADQSNINDCLATGMETFLAKPLKRPQLREVLMDLGIQVKERK